MCLKFKFLVCRSYVLVLLSFCHFWNFTHFGLRSIYPHFITNWIIKLTFFLVGFLSQPSQPPFLYLLNNKKNVWILAQKLEIVIVFFFLGSQPQRNSLMWRRYLWQKSARLKFIIFFFRRGDDLKSWIQLIDPHV